MRLLIYRFDYDLIKYAELITRNATRTRNLVVDSTLFIQLKVKVAHNIAITIPIPAARPPINIIRLARSSPFLKRAPAHS